MILSYHYNQRAGFHALPDGNRFQVFWSEGTEQEADPPIERGWYWWPIQAGSDWMPCDDSHGPFASSAQAYHNAVRTVTHINDHTQDTCRKRWEALKARGTYTAAEIDAIDADKP
jgi:hypothetical protein